MAKVVTNEVRFSYTHLWEPQAINGSEPKYSVSLIIPKKDTETIKAIKEAIETAKKDGIAKFGGKIPANLKLPLRDYHSILAILYIYVFVSAAAIVFKCR